MSNPVPEGFIYDSEAEKASASYLISTVVLVIGLPFPILNMLATFIFWLSCRRETWFVRFHAMQSLLSQLPIVVINSAAIVWMIRIVFGGAQFSNSFMGFAIAAAVFNVVELVASAWASVLTRRKRDVRYWFFGPLTELIVEK